MRILHEALSTVSASDIAQLCSDQIPEGTELELKSDLPSRGGRGDPWHAGARIGDYARNEVAEEIIAFANSFGGAVCVGINETADHPKRADSPHLLPRVHYLDLLASSMQALGLNRRETGFHHIKDAFECKAVRQQKCISAPVLGCRKQLKQPALVSSHWVAAPKKEPRRRLAQRRG
jgi:hypothetical protein